MAMSIDDHQVGLLWENRSWGLSNSDNSGESSKEKLEILMKAANQRRELGNELGNETLVTNKKRGRGSASRNEKKAKGKGRESQSDHEMHIFTERQRRKKMRNMFASLHALLPKLPSKADKSSIVDEAVSYIKNLQQTLEKLEKLKQERLQSVSPNYGYDHQSSSVNMNSPWHPHDSREAFIADHHNSNINDQYSSNNNALNLIPAATPRTPVTIFQTYTIGNVVLNICGDDAQFCMYTTKKRGLLSTIAFVLEKYKIDVISANVVRNGNGNACMVVIAKPASHQFQGANSMDETYKQAAREIALLTA